MADLNVKVGLDRSGFQTGLAAMENSISKFGSRMTGILAGSFSFAAIGAGISRAIDQGDQLQDLANRFGVAASSIQEIGNAASLSGASVEDVASAMNKLAKNAGEAVMDPQGNMAKSFEQIGLSVEKLKGMSPQDLFMELSKAVASGSLGMSDFAVAQELAGRAALQLMETFRMGPNAIRQTGQAMGVMSDETIAALSRASDAIKTLQMQMTNAFGGVAQFLVPAIDMFKMLAEQIGMVSAASAALFSGNFKDAMTIAAAGKKARDEFFNKTATVTAPVLRNTEATLTKSTKENTDARIAQYDREAAAKEASASRWKRAMEEQMDLDAKEEVTAARMENRAMIREAQRRRDATPGSENFERLREKAGTEWNRIFNQPVSDEQVFRANPGLRAGLSDMAGTGAMKSQQEGPKEATVQSINQKVDDAVNRLDELIRASGTFGI